MPPASAATGSRSASEGCSRPRWPRSRTRPSSASR
ncbi:hypothetical protein R2601_02718 [Salipiger bermudensis HTCC2601]|uniref:Uncharacterized protein n=1 Tax=Salipiger bermudensis (strain DSM 26914 / JCM 13377 / KCTC 12554 / HTCC2601) TaxID=314265 RepID=Q0FWV2_SALBH|nr:hypothetical protein R2601_02718 [Salipiger bermudensis HTCC2601]